MDPKYLELEITEETFLESSDICQKNLLLLSEYGLRISIDDFGTGYSSLSYLAELPVQTLKIDRVFTERITESKTNARVVQAIIALGKALQLRVIAEGVETEQQLQLVTKLGCDVAQGFFIGRPMPEEDFLDWCNSVRQLEDTPVLEVASGK